MKVQIEEETMKMPKDKRSILVSWPKRIYTWDELPAPFCPALQTWRNLGMPMENVAYIPRLFHEEGEPEYLSAWWGAQALLQIFQEGKTRAVLLEPGRVRRCCYHEKQPHALVEIEVDGFGTVSFPYNKTRKQLRSILDIVLGNSPDAVFPTGHPQTPELQKLQDDSYSMYNLSRLCYRFGRRLLDFLWLRGRDRNLFRRVDPEYWVGATERGLTAISCDRNGSRTVWIAWSNLSGISLEGEGRGRCVRIVPAAGAAVEFPVLSGQMQAAEAFLKRIDALEVRKPPT